MSYFLKINFNKIFTSKFQKLFFQEETREVIIPSHFFEKTSYYLSKASDIQFHLMSSSILLSDMGKTGEYQIKSFTFLMMIKCNSWTVN